MSRFQLSGERRRASAIAVCMMGALGVLCIGSEPSAGEQQASRDYDALLRAWEADQQQLLTLRKSAELSPAGKKKWSADMRATKDVHRAKFMSFALTRPNSQHAADALVLIAQKLTYANTPDGTDALRMLLRDYPDDERLGVLAPICEHGKFGEPEELLHAILAASSHPRVQAAAIFSLAQHYHRAASGAELTGRTEHLKLAKAYYQHIVDEYGSMVAYESDADVRSYGVRAAQAIHEIETLGPGSPAPEIIGADTEGRILKLSDYKGRVVVLSFWWSRCPRCIAMFPHEREWVRRFADQPFAVLGVNSDIRSEDAQKAIAKHELTFPSWFDGAYTSNRETIVKAWNVIAYPTVVVIDATGVIRLRSIGPSAETVENLIVELLSKAAVNSPNVNATN